MWGATDVISANSAANVHTCVPTSYSLLYVRTGVCFRLTEMTGSERTGCVRSCVYVGNLLEHVDSTTLQGSWLGRGVSYPWDVPFVYGRNLKTSVV